MPLRISPFARSGPPETSAADQWAPAAVGIAALRADEARAHLREAAHPTVRRLSEPRLEAPLAPGKSVSNREAERLRMPAQARELAGYLDRWRG